MRIILYFLCFTVSFVSIAQNNTSDFCEKTTSVLSILSENHYRPKPVDDQFSTYVFETFFKRIDPKRLFYTQESIAELSEMKTQLDDYIINKECNFIEKLTDSYKKQLLIATSRMENFRAFALDFSGKDKVTYGSFKEAHQFSENENTLQKRWSKKIRVDVIRDYLSLSNPQNFTKIKKEIKAKVLEESECYILDKLQVVGGIQAHVETVFLDVICSYFDPHSSYFDASANTTFMNAISTETNSIGVHFSKNSDGKILVAGLQTGSTAWKEKEIHSGDLILSVSANGETLSTVCLSLESLNNFINDEEKTTISLKILTEKNIRKTVVLKKENLKIEQNAVNSFILKGKQNIGYISLPSFYTNVDYGYGSANDIAKELFKLNSVAIDGLILDLRNNGGGSMKQAIDLAGMFIDKGPLGIYRDQKNNKTIVKDFNRGTLFTKPLVILINNGSASASEFIAAALRDHNRAILVGSKTHGKGTIQNIFPMEDENSFVKVTIEKMYGFKGDSHQAKGITPTITFPNIYMNLDDGEREYDNYIVNDTVVKNIYFSIPETADYQELRAKSDARLAKSKPVKILKKINQDLLNYLNSEREMPISVAGISKDMERFDAVFEKYEDAKLKHRTFKVLNLEDYKEILDFNEEKAADNDYIIKNIQTDYEIEESYRILSDYIQKLHK